MTISLAKGHSYQVVFWAQNSECTAYTVSDDMKVSINYDGLNNDEARDAFFGKTEVFKVDRSSTISVILKRPFAQVNVGAFPFDFEHVKDMGVNISKSSATFKAVANQIDLLSGEATGEVDVTYSLNTLPNEDLEVDVDENGVKETYEWLSMSYLLAGTTQSLHSMEFTFSNTDGTDLITFDGLNNIGIKRNYRTNIVGQILTGTISFNIKIDPIYEGETINSAGLYYNFSEDTIIKDKEFAFNTNEWATFTTENNNLMTLDNVTFSGKIGQIAIGEYRGKTINDVPYTNVLKNVTAKDMHLLSNVKSNGNHEIAITNVEPIDYMSLLLYIRGVATITDCVFTGTTSVAEKYIDYYGDVHDVQTYDCGLPNYTNATFEGCTIGRIYAWSHSLVTLKDTKVDYIRCSTHNQTHTTAHLTIDAGSEIETIVVSSSGTTSSYKDENGNRHWTATPWAPSLIIKAGATVNVLDMNGRSRYDKDGNLDVIIEDGATVNSIINEDTSNVPEP